MQLLKSAGFPVSWKVAEGRVSEWRAGDAWGEREPAHRVSVRSLVPTASPEPASDHRVPFLMFSTLIFLPYFHVQ